MIYFILGWLTGLTIIVAIPHLFRSKRAIDTWTYEPNPQGTTTVTTVPPTREKAEFLPSTRVDEIISGKRDVNLGDILI